jgi:hypothetical protein
MDQKKRDTGGIPCCADGACSPPPFFPPSPFPLPNSRLSARVCAVVVMVVIVIALVCHFLLFVGGGVVGNC